MSDSAGELLEPLSALKDAVHKWGCAEALVIDAAQKLGRRLEEIGADVPSFVYLEVASIRELCNGNDDIGDPEILMQRLEILEELLGFLDKREMAAA